MDKRPLPPFWRYYGGKNRAAKLYPAPEHDTIIEPFAGAAGYSCRYPHKRVILVDRSPIIAGIWRYLIATPSAEILAIPDIPEGGTVDDLPVCQEARWLAGFWCGEGRQAPGKRPSAWVQQGNESRGRGGDYDGWTEPVRRRLASNVHRIRHWQVIEGEYRDAPDIEATWHIDPPYNNRAGQVYPYQPAGFDALGAWCRTRRGLVMVCENEGADWLPFQVLATTPSTLTGKRSAEVIWTNRPPRFSDGGQARLFGGQHDRS